MIFSGGRERGKDDEAVYSILLLRLLLLFRDTNDAFCHHLRRRLRLLDGHAVSGQSEIESRREEGRREDEERGESERERIPFLSSGLRAENEEEEEERAGASE